MTTIRRVYLYLATFIGMAVTLAGVFILIDMLVLQGFDAFRGFAISRSAPALALVVAGALTWRFYWRTVQREAMTFIDERASGTRKLYLYGTMTIALLAALLLAQQVLGELLVRLLVLGLEGYRPWTPLLIAAVLIAVWRAHEQIAQTDAAVGADGMRGGDLRRGYWFALTYFGGVTATNGLTALIAGLLSSLSGRPPLSFDFPRSDSWLSALLPPLAQLIVAGFAIWKFWLPSQRAAAGGDAVERASQARSVLIHVFVLSAAISTVSGAQIVLGDILNRLLQGSRTDALLATLSAPPASLVVGGLLLAYFFRAVRPTLINTRPSDYLIAGVGFFVAVIGGAQLVAALLQALGGEGERIEALIANIGPPLIAGGALWRWRWRVLEIDTSPEARSDVWRKIYLHFFQLGGLAMLLAGGVQILSTVISAVLQPPAGPPAPGPGVMASLATPLALLLTGSALMIYTMQTLGSDGRIGALSVEETMQRTIGDRAPTWAIAALVWILMGPVITILALAALGPVIGNIFSSIISGLE